MRSGTSDEAICGETYYVFKKKTVKIEMNVTVYDGLLLIRERINRNNFTPVIHQNVENENGFSLW